MKFSIGLLILTSACLVVLADMQTKHNLGSEHERGISMANPSYDQIETESLTAIVRSGADAISRAIEMISPITRSVLKIVIRLYNGGSNSKKDREYEEHLLARMDKIISDAKEGKAIADIPKIPAAALMKILQGYKQAFSYIRYMVPIELKHDFTFFATIGRLILGGYANAVRGIVTDVRNVTSSLGTPSPSTS